jgi:hypothetical protein
MRKLGPIGPRLLKTGLAVALTVFLIRLTLGKYEVFGALAAVLAVAPSASHSLKNAAQLISANILGGLIGAAAVVTFGPNPVVMGFVVVLVLLLCQTMRWRSVASSAVTVTLFVMAPHVESVYTYTAGRFVAVVIGSLIGTAINAWVARPDHRMPTLAAIRDAGAELDRFSLAVSGQLEKPDALSKAAIKAGAALVEAQLSEARRCFTLLSESAVRGGDTAERAVLERAIQVLASLLERIQIIHKAALAAACAPAYATELPEIREAIHSIVLYRRQLFHQVTDRATLGPLPAAGLAAIELHFENAMAALPQQPEEAEAYFRLYRMRNSVAYMAQRLGRLCVAAGEAFPEPVAEPGALVERIS